MEPAQPEARSPEDLCLAVYRGGHPVFVLDEASRLAAPNTVIERAEVALILAHASAYLAALPVPESFPERARITAARLAEIGTPAAGEKLEELEAAARRHIEAFDAAVAFVNAATPIH